MDAVWGWFILAIGLIVLEMLLGGQFFIWLSGAAAATGLVGVVLQLFQVVTGWEVYVLTFCICSFAGLGMWYYQMVNRKQGQHSSDYINHRTSQFVGQQVKVSRAIENGRGKVLVDDTAWIAEGEDCPVGSKVKIVGASGTVLKVCPIEPEHEDDEEVEQTTKPVTKPVTKPATKPATKPVSKPDTTATLKPETKPTVQPATKTSVPSTTTKAAKTGKTGKIDKTS